MLPQTEEQVERLRNATNAAKAKLDEAKALPGDNDDDYMRGLIRQATFWLDDIETHFIAILTEDPSPPRTLAQESVGVGF
jgi:hypothetical protein